jgi:hypothetical protein
MAMTMMKIKHGRDGGGKGKEVRPGGSAGGAHSIEV